MNDWRGTKSAPLSHAGIPKSDSANRSRELIFNTIALALEMQHWNESLVRIVTNFEVI
jgi:hypothetical protein